ncbi:hypothetical protein K437DRAFT_258723 [Tilletiaria anomala UBC 951]|uniref:Nicotinamide N-methyltransferase n=1 Tax=Tilletiaria anomala (strain ATCC 24038 / CBS 436.72 / UBC 951) TaxID=1037660 RepID=A0A066VET9_TILAU|nr:uncharacterized protein K437DRAFT_258723 [Tilletiaria anomala UBC 951]KDN40257.1 hypothetical protein K437DRAFT_258723 [Tilletiaria anomala UBC 951]
MTAARSSPAFHPSIGLPGQAVTYVPNDISAWHHSRGAAHSSDAVEPGTDRQALGIREEPITSVDSGSSIYITVTVPPASIHSIFAHRQWRAGMILADLIYSSSTRESGDDEMYAKPGLLDVSGKHVLELGAGTALPGIVAARTEARAQQVVISDYDEEALIMRLKANVKANVPPAPAGSRSHVTATGHIWGQDVSELLDLIPEPYRLQEALYAAKFPQQLRFTTILLADCLWDSLSHTALLRTITRTLERSAHARVYVVSGLHTGRETLVSFIRRARREGIVLKKWLDIEEEQLAGEEAPAPQEKDQTRRARLVRSNDPDDADAGEEGWEAYLLEVQLALDEEDHGEGGDTPSTSQEAGSTSDSTVPALLAVGSRIDPLVTRPFSSVERPEERKEIGGVQPRNRWITLWSLGWSSSALDG